MARGFESKSVADQQEQAEAQSRSRPRDLPDPHVAAQRRRLELSLADVRAKRAAATAPRLKDMLARAEADLEKELAKV
jgi:hypothetical protein